MPGDFLSRPGISILNETGDLLPVVYEIMEVIKKYNGVLATGHISPKESVLLCRAGRAYGVKMVLTHPEFDRTLMDTGTQRELAALGVAIEKCWFNLAAGMEHFLQTLLEEGFSRDELWAMVSGVPAQLVLS